VSSRTTHETALAGWLTWMICERDFGHQAPGASPRCRPDQPRWIVRWTFPRCGVAAPELDVLRGRSAASSRTFDYRSLHFASPLASTSNHRRRVIA
jgi:hypothetical protein